MAGMFVGITATAAATGMLDEFLDAPSVAQTSRQGIDGYAPETPAASATPTLAASPAIDGERALSEDAALLVAAKVPEIVRFVEEEDRGGESERQVAAALDIRSGWDPAIDHARAEAFCGQLSRLGEAPWRLPTAAELRQLGRSRALDRRAYWSATPAKKKIGSFLVFDASRKRTKPIQRDKSAARVTCVRSRSST
jgi:hypothetical protein